MIRAVGGSTVNWSNEESLIEELMHTIVRQLHDTFYRLNVLRVVNVMAHID